MKSKFPKVTSFMLKISPTKMISLLSSLCKIKHISKIHEFENYQHLIPHTFFLFENLHQSHYEQDYVLERNL